MIDHGLSSCDKGFGFTEGCAGKLGKFQLPAKSNADDTISELSLLLTGGRLSATDVVKTAYEAAAAEEKYKVAQRAIVLSPEFHTLGNPLVSGSRPATLYPDPSPGSS